MGPLPRQDGLGRNFEPGIPTLKIAKVIRVRPGGNRIDVCFLDGGYGTAIPVVSGCASSIAGFAHLIGPTVDAVNPADPTYRTPVASGQLELSAGQDPPEFSQPDTNVLSDLGGPACWVPLKLQVSYNSDGSVSFDTVEQIITVIEATTRAVYEIGQIALTLEIAAATEGAAPPLLPFVVAAASIAIAVETMLSLFGGRPKFQDTDDVIAAYKKSKYWPLHSLAADLQEAANNGAPISDSRPQVQTQFSTWKRGTIESLQSIAGWQPGPQSPGYWQLQRLINFSWFMSRQGEESVIEVVRAIDAFVLILACLFIHSEPGATPPESGKPPPVKTDVLVGNRDIYAVCQQAEGYLIGNAGMICIGFLHNDDVSEILFPQDSDQKRFADFLLFRHPSDVQITIDKLGTTSIQHPSGARVTVGDIDALGESVIAPDNPGVNLTKLDANTSYQLRNNTSRPTGIVLKSAAGDYIRIWNGKIEIVSPSVTVNGVPV